MFLEAFKTIVVAMAELIVLGAVGFWLVHRKIVSENGLKMLSDLVIGLFLPCLMFTEIIKRFEPSLYPDWWMYPFLSMLMAIVGFFCGSVFLIFDKTLEKDRREFLGVTSFQNSGYLPLPLAASLLPAAVAPEMFIYIFLFLIGFNMMIFSWGACILDQERRGNCFDIKHIFNAPVVATVAALALVFLRMEKFVPALLMHPAESLGRVAIPLSIIVVGGNLASIEGRGGITWRPIASSLLIKLIVLPCLFLGALIVVRPKPLVGLLILLQAAMPPAALLSVISKSQKQGAHLINSAIFYGHLISVVTIPVFLALFWLIFHSLY